VSPWRWIALWACFLAALTALMFVFDVAEVGPLLLGGAALGTLALAVVAAASRPARGEPSSSLPAMGVAFGVALLVGGSEFGTWMLAIGVGLLVLSLGSLLRERRA
jgi:hypothetical protein